MIRFFPYTALSLTTPAVSRDFISYFFLSTNTPSPRHADRVSVAALFHLCHPNSLGPFRFINSVWPTNHLFGHYRP